jgi:glycosyltransferase involved in cell wall biosynthesis
MKVAVIIPTINEPAIEKVISDVQQTLAGYDVDVIVVDKSDDDTPQRAARAGAKVITQSGAGYGDAYLQGFEHIEDADVVVMLDGDDTYDASDIPKLLKPIEEGRADLAIGNRFANMEKGAMSTRNKYGNKLLTWLLNRLYRVHLRDTQSGFRAIRADKLNAFEFTSTGMPFASEMIIEAIKNRLRIMEVPTSYKKRVGEPKLKAYKDASLIIGLVIRLLRDYNPLTLFIPPGLILILAGVALGITVVLQWIHTGEITRLASTILAALLIMAGLQILFFGLLADVILAAFRRHGRR